MFDNGSRRDDDVSKALGEHYENADMSESYQRKLLASMLGAKNRRRVHLPAVRWFSGAAAVAALVLICLGMAHLVAVRAQASRLLAVTELRALVTNGSGHKLKVGDYVAAGETVCTGKGGRITLVARNGSTIHLDQQSELMLDARGNATVSKGRLYCRNRMHAITTIDTPAGSIRLLGTVLDAAVINKNTAAVTVVEGRVELSNLHGKTIVEKGNRAVMNALLAPEEGSPVDIANETAWYDGQNRIVSANGEIAYMVSRRKGVLYDQQDPIAELWAMKSDGSDKHLLAALVEPFGTSRSGSCIKLGDWYPGGQWVLVAAQGPINWTNPSRADIPNSLHLIDVSTGQDTYLPLPTDFSREDGTEAAVSPDGMQIAVSGRRGGWSSMGTATPRDQVFEEGIWICDTRSGELRPLLTHAKRGYTYSELAWSHDSRWLAVREWKGNFDPRKIILIDTQTGKTRQVAEGDYPAFSPDGTKLAYCETVISPGSAYPGSVCVIDINGSGNVSRLAAVGDHCTSPTWSPDGSKVGFVTVHRNRNVCVVRTAEVDGSGTHDIYAARGPEDGVSWDRSGDYLYIRKHARMESAVLKVAADGSGLIADLGGNEDDSIPPDEVWEQLTQVRLIIADAFAGYWQGEWRMLQGRFDEGRNLLRDTASSLYELPWRYPLARVSIPDVITTADAANELASSSNEEALSLACGMRVNPFTKWHLEQAVRGGGKLPPDLEALRKREGFGEGLSSSELPDSRFDTLTCPGKHRNKPVPYIYTPPKDGEPKIGDVIFQCPNHPEHKVVWDKILELSRNRRAFKPAAKR